MSEPGTEPLLSVCALTVEVATPAGDVAVVDRISFELRAGEVLGVVGESGSGKSMTMLAIMGLLPAGTTHHRAEALRLQGRELTGLSPHELMALRGRRMAMIFQEPMTSLNPVLTVGRQIADAVRVHNPQLSSGEVRERTLALLARVGVPDPARRLGQYPHEFSGGMRQRVMIAMAIANEPDILIADEPTTALDVTIQAQVMDLLARVGPASGRAMVLVTHDLGLIAENADRVVVMYAGRIVEVGPVERVFERPAHPYTVSLLDSLPRLDAPSADLRAIPGQPPAPERRPPGCVFHPRCQIRNGRARCAEEQPQLQALEGGGDHASACHFAGELTAAAQPAAATMAAGAGSAGRAP